MLESRKGSMFVVCVTVGLVLLASKYRDDVLRSVGQICHGISGRRARRRESKQQHKDALSVVAGKNGIPPRLVSPKSVILADSPEQCDYAVQRIRRDLADGVLGFDCEWVNEGPVSLLQLATRNGLCALFRLGKIGHVPTGLKELLKSQEVLKVGVGPEEDARRIAKDYSCQVFGTVDLRTLASRLSLPCPRSLAALCVQYLGVEIDKTAEVRCGDWNADSLTDEQITYASTDAYVSVLVYQQILLKTRQNRNLWESIVSFIKRKLHKICKDKEYFDLPNGVIDARFKALNDQTPNRSDINVNNNIGQISSKSCTTPNKNSIPARNRPLYHNCYLQAPDGETLCTCDKRKAEWYVSKQLGEIVQEDPLTVRLKFEPSGRALGEVGKYYTQVKLNQCVVCGSSDKFIRKNVVPREYRKYFPLVMKSHQSHDVLLLCPGCHQESNCHDLKLRRELARICDAPLTGPISAQRNEKIPQNLKILHSAVRVLRDQTPVPPERRKELEMYVLKFTNQQSITPELLDVLHEQFRTKGTCKNNFQDRNRKNTSPPPVKCQPHGLKVVQYFQNRDSGLVGLEKIWREHFLETMKPKYLPELWSVSHNQQRLNIRQIQNRIEPQDARLAGLNS